MHDSITKTALKIIEDSNDVLETKEIQEKISVSIKDITRTKLFSRLNNLRGEGLIKGKFVGPGKGVWIWWKAAILEPQKSSQVQIFGSRKSEDFLGNKIQDKKRGENDR